MIARWENIYLNRFDWAYEARKKFILTLSNGHGITEKMKDQKGIIIAVYGNSQVGKTSLILKLIGIKDEYYQEIYDILRFDVPKGKSVTATSMVYKKSHDDNFYFQFYGQSESKVSKVELKKKLMENRKAVEENKFEISNKDAESNIQISLPQSYFNEAELDMIIIDLPGINSSNQKEHSHVKSVIKDIIPLASLVLFVCETITHFNPGEIQLDEMKKWHREPDRFRLILTRSVSAHSVKDIIKKNKQINKHLYIEHYNEQFERSLNGNVNIFDKNKMKIYPLEYGESFIQLSLDSPDIYRKSKIIIDELLEQLREDILLNSSEHKLLLRTANYWAIIEKDLIEEKEMIENEIEINKKDIEGIREKNIILYDFIHLKEIELAKIEERKNSFIELSEKYFLNSSDYKYKIIATDLPEIKSYETNISYFRYAISKFITKINSDILKILVDIKNDYYISVKVNSKEIESILDDGFEKIRVDLNAYILDEYWPSLSSDFDSDRETLKVCSENALISLDSFLKKEINGEVQKMLKDIEKQYNRLLSAKILTINNIKESDSKIIEKERNILKLEDEIVQKEKSGNDDRIKCENFFKYLEEGFREKLSSKKKENTKLSAEEKLLSLFEQYLIASEMEKLEQEHTILNTK
jgi:GTPase SAR1 family protein